MSKSDLQQKLTRLYEVVEVNNIGAVPLQVASETLRLINPGLTQDMSDAIAADCDSRGKQQLIRDDFVRAGLTCLQNTDVMDAIGLVKDLTVRMRVAFRRRFLMYDAPANEPPPALVENSRTVAMYRELFDLVSRDAEGMTRAELHRLTQAVLPEYPVDASNVVKAALADRETDLIGFYEVMMSLQPTTSRRCLSDMLSLARRDVATLKAENSFEAVASGVTASSARAASVATTVGANANTSSSTAVGARPTTSKATTDRLRQELQSYQMQEALADQRANEAMSARASLATVPIVPRAPAPLREQIDAELQRENEQLRLENEDLRRQNDTLTAELRTAESRIIAGNASGAPRARSVSQVSRRGDSVFGGNDDEDADERLEELEEELRQARARLAIANESNELVMLLRRGENPHDTVRKYYPDESVFIGKHRYLQEAVQPFMDGVSPLSTIIGQYDLLVVGYQALYRQLRAEADTEKARSTFDPVAAAKSIIPRNPAHVTPARRGSPSTSRSSPMRWKDLDREPATDMRGTGTLADPLLTDEERHTLRAKLAAQMRGSARYYDPRRGSSPSTSRARSPASSVGTDSYHRHSFGGGSGSSVNAPTGVKGASTSQAAMQRLQTMASRAQRAHHFD